MLIRPHPVLIPSSPHPYLVLLTGLWWQHQQEPHVGKSVSHPMQSLGKSPTTAAWNLCNATASGGVIRRRLRLPPPQWADLMFHVQLTFRVVMGEFGGANIRRWNGAIYMPNRQRGTSASAYLLTLVDIILSFTLNTQFKQGFLPYMPCAALWSYRLLPGKHSYSLDEELGSRSSGRSWIYEWIRSPSSLCPEPLDKNHNTIQASTRLL